MTDLRKLQDAMGRRDVDAISDVLGLVSMVERAEKRALLARYPIEQIVDVLIGGQAADLAQCVMCEGKRKLVPCRYCHEFVCMDCAKHHPCNQVDGPSTDVLRG